MAAKDVYHETVRAALEKDGWTITHDPLRLHALGHHIKIDLGAEKLIGAEKAGSKIAVEVKSFVGMSVLADFYAAIGQCVYDQAALDAEEPDRKLYLAVPMARELFSGAALCHCAGA
ncbi:MAG: element excision factor XisH family protein [Bacteroidia bacterium]|nr:element excision factor XisH family protein [Bacteroidia bacterium]